MNEAINAFGGITVKDIIIYATAIYWIYEIGKRWYKGMTSFHDKQQEQESILKVVKENTAKINYLAQTIDDLIARDKEYKLRSLADKLFVCYNQAKLQGYITRRQLENYIRNEKLYKELGGNGIVEDKYHPEIFDMEIHED